MAKPASLFPKLTKKQLRAMMSPKQKAFIASLESEGATFDIIAVKGRPWIQNIVRQKRYYGAPDYDMEYEAELSDLYGLDGWGEH